MKHEIDGCPTFAWVFLIGIGAVDLTRGFMHTVLLQYSATNIAGLDLSHSAGDQLQLLGVFGVSNWLTGLLFIVIGLKARHLVPYALSFILLSYFVAGRIVKAVAHTTAPFGGRVFMLVYLIACAVVLAATLALRVRDRVGQARRTPTGSRVSP